MRRIMGWRPVLWCAVVLMPAAASSWATAPQPIVVQELEWTRPPEIPGLRFTWVLGGNDRPGMYVLRVGLDRGAVIPPHTHPDMRHSTVLAGTLYIGFGREFDRGSMIAVAAGDVCVVPAGKPHYLAAGEDGALYQESGVGPTATTLLPTN